jgi:hypothetical protein
MKAIGFVAGWVLAWLLSAGSARAQGYARPPDGYWEGPAVVDAQDSAVRLNVGPALKLGPAPILGGLATSIDVGAKSAGARFSAAWFHAGSDKGLSQYAGELWIDFGARRRLRPVLAAGAGVARIDALDAVGDVQTSTMGVALLRGTLEYVLPVTGVDGRVGIDLEGAVPAIRGSGAPDVAGWIVTSARVGVGF